MKKNVEQNNGKLRVALYCRVATDADERKSLEAQKEKLRKYAEQQGYEVVAVVEEVGGGLPFKRPGIKKVFRLAHRHFIDAVLTENLSRIGRDISTTFRIQGKLKKQHVAIKTLWQEETALPYLRYFSKLPQ